VQGNALVLMMTIDAIAISPNFSKTLTYPVLLTQQGDGGWMART
jgi:hypothetical protein